MTPQFPFKGGYTITQGYADNFNNYPGGHHGGLDIVPLDDKGHAYPADIFPILDGDEISIQDTDVKRGKGVKVKSKIDAAFIRYLQDKGYLPKNLPAQDIFIEHLYWHCLDVTDEDGKVDQQTPIAKCGNSGLVYSGGSPVPDSQKGVPPYPGLHLHLETVITGSIGGTFNLEKDAQGRVDPMIILNYKPMHLAKDNGTVYLIAGVNNKVKIGIADEASLALFGDEPVIEENTSAIPDTKTITTGFSIHNK